MHDSYSVYVNNISKYYELTVDGNETLLDIAIEHEDDLLAEGIVSALKTMARVLTEDITEGNTLPRACTQGVGRIKRSISPPPAQEIPYVSELFASFGVLTAL